jgi:hypothetical protein
MGYVLNADLETSLGPTQELYVRVEGFTFNKVTAQLSFQITYWVDREKAIKFNKIFLEEPNKNAKGLIQNKVIHFADDEEEGKELELSQFEKVLVANEDEIEIPIFEEQDVRKDVPYISFDENGDEITKYREVIRKQKVQVGMKKEVRSVIDVKAFNNIYEYCYKKLHEYLSTLFPLEQIVKV